MNKKLNELRGMGETELLLKLTELKNTLAKEKAVKSTNTRPENPGKARRIRRQIATILTISTEKRREKNMTRNQNKSKTKNEVTSKGWT